ncbi:MAG TPA: hypothetical protein VHJ83_04460, partial [Micromonosporaceae bacterium]|nr:hypothetical protein [Micromonosporaceae bacterium]
MSGTVAGGIGVPGAGRRPPPMTLPGGAAAVVEPVEPVPMPTGRPPRTPRPPATNPGFRAADTVPAGRFPDPGIAMSVLEPPGA